MMFLQGLAVIFAGLVGGNDDVDAQVKKLFGDLQVKSVALPSSSVQKLTRYGAATRDVVRKLRADGVIAAEIVQGSGAASLRIVIYEGDGRLKTYSELPLTGKKLGRAQLDVLRANLRAEVDAMRDDDPSAAVVVAPSGGDEPPRSSRRRAAAASEEDTEVAAIAGRDPSPAGSAAEGQRGSIDEDDSPEGFESVSARAPDATPAANAKLPKLGASAGIGVATRSFSAGSTTVLPYESSPVPALALDAHLQATRSIRIALAAERTMALTTRMGDGSAAPTSITRIDAHGSFSLIRRGSLDLGFRFGGGRRAFAIESSDPVRSPDSAYSYVITGLATTLRATERVVLRAGLAFEPVVQATEPPGMELGSSVRWAFEVDAELELRLTKHLFARAAAHYQRFAWSWNMPGETEGSASDAYPSAVLTLGAAY